MFVRIACLGTITSLSLFSYIDFFGLPRTLFECFLMGGFKSKDYEIKERLGRIECGKKIQELFSAEEITDEDIQQVKENGPKYDTEENVNKAIEILELKRDPVLGKLFNDKLWKKL